MGTLYWQINDIYPVASWASIVYYGRFKALQYAAKRFYSPILISCQEIGEKDTREFVTMERSFFNYETKATLCLTNDTGENVTGKVRWALRSSDAYARYVEIYSPDSDFVLSDNYFDMNGGTKVVDVLEGCPKTISLRSVYDIK